MASDKLPLYLDFNATTPLDPRVFEAMRPWFLDEYGNAGSRTHVYGQRAKVAVDSARGEVGRLVGANPEEVIFTSGATESNNIAILGIAQFGTEIGRRHVISTAIEHKAVLEPLDHLRKLGFEVELAPVTSGGYIEPSEIQSRLRSDTLLVSVMHANNETGVLQPVEEIAQLLEGSRVYFHTDAAQTFGKEVEVLKRMRYDLVSISAHKIYGPKGIGALVVRRRKGEKTPLSPLFFGGGQERGLRPGTLPVPLIVGLGKAASIAAKEFLVRRDTALLIKKRFLADLKKINLFVNGDLTRSQSHVINLWIKGIDSEALMMALRDDMAISNGSACTSANYTPSHVLLAMGREPEEALESIRISWGPGIDYVPTFGLISACKKLFAG